jgi:TolA-binding protein
MSKSFLPSLVAAVTLACGGFVATQAVAQAPTPKVTPALAKTFKAAQEAQAAKRWPEVIAKANEVLAAGNRKPDDTYYANYLLFEAARATNDIPAVMKALQGQIDSGFLPEGEQSKLIKALMALAYQQRDYGAAIDYGTRLTKGGSADSEVFTTIGQSYFQQGKYADAARFFNSLVTDTEKRGGTPREQHLQLLQAAYAKAGNAEAAQAALEKLVMHYPTEKTWSILLFDVKKDSKDPRQRLHVFRLQQATGNLKLGADYSAYSEVATAVGLPAEAYNVLDAALKANVFTVDTDKARAERYLTSSKNRADADKAQIAKRAAEAKAAAAGDLDVALGMSLFSQGDYTGSVEALNRGIAKGNLRNAADAQLTLGVAQLKANQKADALKTFKGIQTEDPTTQRIVKLWTLYAS